ncbi:hypothetical protein [Pseudovibrio sp. Ad26]|uniref:hypothetical protein n=1 Tax=Pseudovibrio sp. Ad26 TaxID=989410 RepID=UPI0007AE5935|nr:hypothetical protein [Pseudovibrio sp. Ad26]KZL05538.1 hypothetical protein PsAD26_04335 [Pseudovibrio sp. Ad26]
MPEFHPVTDHAVLRYMERVLEIDVGAVRDLIRRETETALLAGAVGLRSDAIRYVFADGKVVTIMPSGRPGGRHG